MQEPTSRHLLDNAADRRCGALWERNFCLLAGLFGKAFTPHQLGRTGAATMWKRGAHDWNPFLLPDVTVWTAPGEHHEIKHKNPTTKYLGGRKVARCYGLEKYRLDALVAFRVETQQPVMYTVHDWELAGATTSRDEMANDVRHWLTVDVLALSEYVARNDIQPVLMRTYVNSRNDEREGYYWPTALWLPLEHWWNPPPVDAPAITHTALFELPDE